MGIGVDIDLDIDSDMAVSRNLGSFKGGSRAPFEGFKADVRQVLS